MLPADLACLDYVATPVFALDVRFDGVPVYSALNACAQRTFGLQPAEFIGLCAREVFPGPDGEGLLAHHMQAIARRGPYSYEVALPLTGGLQDIQTTLVPQLDDTNRVSRLIGTSANMTLQKLAEGTLAASQPLTSEVEDFISMAAHDLRTPMRNVQEIADLLRAEFEDLGDGKTGLIDLLEDVALKASGLISDVLAYSHATQVKGEDLSFDLSPLSNDIHAILDPMQKHTVICPECTIYGNKMVYQIILRNLVDNAFKHGGKEHLTLSIDVRPGGKQMVDVTVRDNGCGFDNPGVAFINSGKLRVDSGFGLLGVRRLVRARGGDISARPPDDGIGSVIRFTLPGMLRYHDTDTTSVPMAVAVR